MVDPESLVIPDYSPFSPLLILMSLIFLGNTLSMKVLGLVHHQQGKSSTKTTGCRELQTK